MGGGFPRGSGNRVYKPGTHEAAMGSIYKFHRNDGLVFEAAEDGVLKSLQIRVRK
ncbi:UNVERIFIED_CONTAM: hypothetical protein Sradi_2267800 [Sesamum radiatum]|uniref:Uncharacterized protein n=1 Tax=Sesamum radiatum TaxID=300843 RepID=A0AAW2T373_SESRA